MDTLVSREEAGWSVEQQRTAGERRRGQGWSGRTAARRDRVWERARLREEREDGRGRGRLWRAGKARRVRLASPSRSAAFILEPAWMPPRAAARLPPLMLPAVAAALTAAELLYLSSFSFSGGAR